MGAQGLDPPSRRHNWVGMLAIAVTPGAPGREQLVQLDEPQPGEDELLVEMLAVGVCGTDREIVEGQADGLVDVPADDELKRRRVDRRRDVRQVPSDVESVRRRQDALIEALERRLEQWWPRPLQDHVRLLRKVRGQRPTAVQEGQLNGVRIARPSRGRAGKRCDPQGAGTSEKVTVRQLDDKGNVRCTTTVLQGDVCAG